MPKEIKPNIEKPLSKQTHKELKISFKLALGQVLIWSDEIRAILKNLNKK